MTSFSNSLAAAVQVLFALSTSGKTWSGSKVIVSMSSVESYLNDQSTFYPETNFYIAQNNKYKTFALATSRANIWLI